MKRMNKRNKDDKEIKIKQYDVKENTYCSKYKVNNNEIIRFGFNTKEGYNAFLKLFNDRVKLERSKVGFISDNKKVYNSKYVMMKDAIELQIYNDVVTLTNQGDFEIAWEVFKNRKKDQRFFINHIVEYKAVLKNIYDNVKEKKWTPNELLKYIESEEKRMKVKEASFG